MLLVTADANCLEQVLTDESAVNLLLVPHLLSSHGFIMPVMQQSQSLFQCQFGWSQGRSGGANQSGVCHFCVGIWCWSSLSTCCCLLLLVVLLKLIVELLLLPVGIILAAVGIELIIKLLFICLQQGGAMTCLYWGKT